MKKKSKKKFSYELLIHTLVVVLVTILIINFFVIASLSTTIKDKSKENEEARRPAVLELTIINAECKECFDVNAFVEKIRKGNVNITNIDKINLEDAKDLIERYKINKLPTVIVRGEVNKTSLDPLVNVEDAYVLTNIPFPYYDVTEDKVKGIVEAVIIKPLECEKCFDMKKIIEEFRSSGIIINKLIELNEKDAVELIKKYSLQTLPAVILSKDAGDYLILRDSWKSYGFVAEDKKYVSEGSFPPFKNLTNSNVEGLVSLTYITDNSCKDCYNVKAHKNIISGFNVAIEKEETFDVSEERGKELLNKYGITKVPTVIVSKEYIVYPGFKRAFLQVGRKLDDGSIVFDKTEIMGVYKDLKTNEVIKPEQDNGK